MILSMPLWIFALILVTFGIFILTAFCIIGYTDKEHSVHRKKTDFLVFGLDFLINHLGLREKFIEEMKKEEEKNNEPR